MDLSRAGKTIGVGASSMDMEGMSYENAHSDGYGCGLFGICFVTAAFDTGSGSGKA